MTGTGLPAGGIVTMAGVGKQFDEQWVLRNVDLHVSPGTIVGLIGPSGCGKTTTVRMATGVHRPDEGEVRLLGHEPAELPAALRQRIGYLPQHPVLFEELSLWENLTFHASLNGVKLRSRRQRRKMLELVELADDRRKAVSQASGGMKRRLALAAALVHEPSLLLLDEPTAGIDPVLRRTFWEYFRSLRDEGRSFIITTQYVGEAADCDVVILLAEGRVIASGSPEDLRRQALGGDMVEVETDRAPDRETIDEFRRDVSTNRVEMAGQNRIRLFVEDGGVAIPRITARLEQDGLNVVDSEEVVISYDEVFIRLVERAADIEPDRVPA